MIPISLFIQFFFYVYPSQRNLWEDISTGCPVFPLAYTNSQTLISITLLNLSYFSHPVDCTITQFKAEDKSLICSFGVPIAQCNQLLAPHLGSQSN